MRRGIGTTGAIAVLLQLCCDIVCCHVARADVAPGPRRHVARHHAAIHAAPAPPRYYARPVHYRPYPYRVPAPFVFGYGPFW